MDPEWNSQPPKGTLACILCKSVISFHNKDKNQYFMHMAKDHGAFFNINLMLIINLLERRQILKLIDNIKSGENEMHTKSVEVQTEGWHKEERIVDDDIAVVETVPAISNTMMAMEGNSPGVNDHIEELRKFLGQISSGDYNKQKSSSYEETSDVSMDFSNSDVENSLSHPLNNEEFNVPSDTELEEVITISTPITNRSKRIKREFIENQVDPMDVLLEEDSEEFNILDVTNEDLVLTPGGPRPIEDYASFVPGAVIPPSYNPTESFSKNEDVDNTTAEEVIEKPGDIMQLQTNMAFKKHKDDIISYLLSCSDYFKRFPKQIVTATKERAQSFTEVDPILPKGWRSKSMPRKGGREPNRLDKEFLSPELKVFRSKIAVLEYMKAMGGYTEEELNAVMPVKIKKERK